MTVDALARAEADSAALLESEEDMTNPITPERRSRDEQHDGEMR
jgi:hypothetical protein